MLKIFKILVLIFLLMITDAVFLNKQTANKKAAKSSMPAGVGVFDPTASVKAALAIQEKARQLKEEQDARLNEIMNGQ